MAAPQDVWEFPGIKKVIHGGITNQHGITPSAATIYFCPQTTPIKATGNLVLSYGNQSLFWKDCLLDSVAAEIGEDGTEIWVATILDRRWRWRYGQISGWYNQRANPDDQRFIQGTERDPRQLVELCLQALGETTWDTKALPIGKEARPVVEWDVAKPAEAMQHICEEFGCRIMLNSKDRPIVVQQGVGRKLQGGEQLVTANSTTLDPVERPPSVIISCAYTQLQVDLLLEAIGEELDGTLKPINQLSYKPNSPNVWADSDLPDFESIANKKARELAVKHIYKSYRIKVPFVIPKMEWAGQNSVINSLSRILPILDVQVEKSPYTGPGTGQALPAWVYGVWCDKNELTENATNAVDPTVQKGDKTKGFYDDSFSLDVERGLVLFSEHVYKIVKRKTPVRIGPANFAGLVPVKFVNQLYADEADLRLRVAIRVRDANTNAFIRYERSRKLKPPTLNCSPRYEKKDDLGITVLAKYNKQFAIVDAITNTIDVHKMADRYLDAIEREYVVLDPTTRRYAGLFPVELDGAIQQVTYTVDGSGKTFTSASYNCETNPWTPPYKERRMLELVKEEVALAPGGRRPAQPPITESYLRVRS